MIARTLISATIAALFALSAGNGLAADEATPAAEHDHAHGAAAESGAPKAAPPAKKDAGMCKTMKGCMRMMKDGKPEASASMLERRVQLLEKRMEVLEMMMRMMHDQQNEGGNESTETEAK